MATPPWPRRPGGSTGSTPPRPRWRATPDELADAEAALEPELRAALLDAIERARAFHQAQRPADLVWSERPGVRLAQRFVPLRRAGVYAPGGLGAYPSSVVMNVVPAQAAGVDQIALATPPGPGGRGHAAILGAAALLGVDEVWLLGGTQAVAALACGTETVPAVDSVTGPGNLYVALAKREVAGRVRTDGFAGPTEVAVLADATADPLLVAVDLVAQAEHDPLAACLLVTDDADLWKAVEPLLAREVAATAHRDRVEAAFAGQSATVLCDDRAAMLRVAEAFAPEHLELLVADPGELAAQVRNAGAVFVGPFDPGGPGRLRRRHQPRPPDRRHGPVRLRPVHPRLPAHHAGGHLRPRRPGHRRPDGGRPEPGRGPPRPRPGGRRPPGRPDRGGAVSASVPRTAGRVRVRDDLAGMTPYGAPQLDVPVRLNTNETPYAVPPEILDDLAEAVRGLELHRYPDREATELREALARHAGHGVEGTWAANGSNEVLQQLLLAFAGPGRSALVVEPTYAMHALLARSSGTSLETRVQPRDQLLDPAAAADLVAEAAADLTFWCSPNNPTGEATGPEVLAAVCAAAPGLVVVDEAYGEFGTSHAAALLSRHPNLVVTRTFSKAFRMAGLRLGYLLADPSVVDGIRLVRLPYHLSALTQAVGLRALHHKGVLMSHVAATERERERVAAALDRLPGVRVLPSDANFLCFETPLDPRRLWQGLLDRGVLIRDVSRYPTLERHLRVTIGTPDEDDAFLTALTEELTQ